MKLARSLFVTALACATGADAQTVRADNPPVWGTSVEVVEELRIGRLDGPPEYAFSVVGDLALDAHGGVYVYDQLDTAIRQFDTRGRFVRQVGRGGSGPGELRRVKGLAVTDDGDLAVWDLGNSRIAVFDSSGTYLRAHRILGGIDEPNAFAVDTSGTFHVKAMLGARASPGRVSAERCADGGWARAFIRVSPAGQRVGELPLECVDPPFQPLILSLPEGPREPFGEAYARVARRDGAVVQAGNHAYTLRVTGPLGDTTVISRDAARVPVSTAERTQWRAWADYLAQEERTRGITHRFLAVPETKPVFRDIMADADSRVWIDRYVPAVDQPRPAREGRPAFRWREPVTYDVIAPDGRFLGTIRPPVPMRVIAARGSVFWGVAEGEAGEQYVVRYRIVRDG